MVRRREILDRLRWSLAALAFLLGALAVLIRRAQDASLPWLPPLLGAAAILSAAGAVDVTRRPRLWTPLGAALVTALLGAQILLIAGLEVLELLPVARMAALAVATAGLWFGTVQVFRMGPIPPSPAPAAAAPRRRFRGWALAAAALIVVATLLPSLLPPPPLDPTLDGFRASWDSGDWVAVGDLFEPAVRPRMGSGLAILLRRRGWLDAAPPLGPVARTLRGGSRARAWFALAGGELRTDWDHRDGRWVLTGVRLPDR